MLGSWQGVNGRNKVENTCFKPFEVPELWVCFSYDLHYYYIIPSLSGGAKHTCIFLHI